MSGFTYRSIQNSENPPASKLSEGELYTWEIVSNPAENCGRPKADSGMFHHDCLQAVMSHEIVSILSWDRELRADLMKFLSRLNLGSLYHSTKSDYPPQQTFRVIMEHYCSQETAKFNHPPCVLTLVETLNEIGHYQCAKVMDHYFYEHLNKTRMEAQAGTFTTFEPILTKVDIPDNDTGNCYQHIFGRFFNETVTCATLVDPYIRTNIQIDNFKEFLRVLQAGCPNVLKIKLITGFDSIKKEKCNKNGIQASVQYQWDKLADLAKTIRKTKNARGNCMNLRVVYDLALHDRSLRLNNGWNISLGRGLDYFYTPTSTTDPAWNDFKLRKCKMTTISGELCKHKDDCKSVENFFAAQWDEYFPNYSFPVRCCGTKPSIFH